MDLTAVLNSNSAKSPRNHTQFNRLKSDISASRTSVSQVHEQLFKELPFNGLPLKSLMDFCIYILE
jgi:hypothetical protein